MLFSDHCYMSMKNVCMHASHHPFLLGCCWLVCFCHLGHTVTQFLLSVLLVSGILLGFLSLALYRLFLHNLSRVSLEWGMKEELCEPQMLSQCLSFSPALLALSATLEVLVSLTSHCKPVQRKLPDTAKLIGCTYLRLNMFPICTHTDPTDSGLSVHGLERLPLKCSLPG